MSESASEPRLNPSGKLAKTFLHTKITPLIIEGDSYHRYDRASMKTAIAEFAEQGKQLLAQSGLSIIAADDMADAAKKAVAAAGGES